MFRIHFKPLRLSTAWWQLPATCVILGCLLSSNAARAVESKPTAPATTVAARPAVTPADGVAAWQKVYTVLIHPRCLNCHTSTNFPQQGDDRHRHLFNVVRGAGGHGVSGMRCATCHQDANADSTGVPGAADWHLAPLSMAWQDRSGKPLSSAAVARQVADRARNGGLDGPELIAHMQNADLVKWAWHPGRRRDGRARSVPPLTHEQLVTATRTWVEAGMPVPPERPAGGR